MVADDTPAVQAVLKADTRRLKLLEEERQLQARLEKGEDSVAERLDKVCVTMVHSQCTVLLPVLDYYAATYSLTSKKWLRV